MDELLTDFLVETTEALGKLDNDLVQLESEPGDKTLIAGIFRTLHTVKGTCGFLGLTKLGHVAHAGENVLGRLRDGSMTATPDVINAILRCVDAIKAIVATIEATSAEGELDHGVLIGELDTLFASGQEAAEPMVDPFATPEPEAFAANPVPAAAPAAPTPAAPAPAPVVAQPAPPPAAAVAPPPAPHAAPPASQPAPQAATAAAPARENPAAGQTIRVGIDLLEALMTTVSELVLTRNQLLQLLRGEEGSAFGAPLQHLSLITSELQESVMKTRMQPIGNAWSTMPRIIRDLARDVGKKIELVMDGAETEMDRQVLELIKDPLTHMIRNSADHGLETPAERIAAGKSETGRIRLHAFHEGGHIIIQVSDDGRGLDVERIRRKAVQNGLATEAEAATMSDAQVFRFVMRPGFSTAVAITAVSGRGVGMDVVRANVEKIGGTIDLASTFGRGACFTMKIPLTLAIVSALIVDCAGERFAIPQISVVELVQGSGSGGESRIHKVGETSVLRLRDRLLPLVGLRGLLGLGTAAETADDCLVIIIQVGAVRFGLIVDRVYDTEEIVVKPVAPLLKGLEVYSGNTILGDGSVCMIIDPNGIVAQVGHMDLAPEEAPADAKVEAAGHAGNDMQRLLLVRAGAGMRKAIPLDRIARLEEIEVNQVRHAGGRMIVQYRDHLMALIPATDDMQMRETGRQSVLVLTENTARAANGSHLDRRSHPIGLLVDEVLDITESVVTIEIDYGRADIIGSAIIDGEPTEIVNVEYHLHSGDSAAGGHESQGMAAADWAAIQPIPEEMLT